MTSEPVSARRAQTQDKLMDAAVRVFADKGVLAASVEEICEQAGFTRGAFYSNFASKDELCVAVLQRQAADDLAAAQRVVASLPAAGLTEPDSLDSLIDSAIRVFLDGLPRDRDWLVASMELRLYAVRNPEVREQYVTLTSQVNRLVGYLISGVLARAGLRLAIPVERAMDLLHAVYEHGTARALIHGQSPDDRSRADQLAALFRSLLRPS